MSDKTRKLIMAYEDDFGYDNRDIFFGGVRDLDDNEEIHDDHVQRIREFMERHSASIDDTDNEPTFSKIPVEINDTNIASYVKSQQSNNIASYVKNKK